MPARGIHLAGPFVVRTIVVRVRVLVTGGAGFIGSHLVDELLLLGHDVLVLDDLSTGSPKNIKSSSGQIEFKCGSILDEDLVDEMMAKSDVVVHLAAAVGVNLIMTRPLESFLTNTKGTEIVANTALRHRKKLLLASTSEIYGKNSQDMLTENSDRIMGPPSIVRWSYATSKAVDEILAFQLNREYGLDAVVLRFFNTVGPRQSSSYGMVLPRMVQQAVRGEPLTVFGDGGQSRCFCHVLDTVAAVLGLMNSEAANGEAFNIGSSHEISIAELARLVIDLTESSSPITFIPYEDAFPMGGYEDMRRRVPDTSKIRSLTGWTPSRPLHQIITEMIQETRLSL